MLDETELFEDAEKKCQTHLVEVWCKVKLDDIISVIRRHNSKDTEYNVQNNCPQRTTPKTKDWVN